MAIYVSTLPHSPTANSDFVGDPTIGLTYSGIVALPESLRGPDLLGAAVTQKQAPLASDSLSEVAGTITSPDSFALTGPSGLATGAPFGTGGPGPVDESATGGDETTTAATALPCDPSQSTLFCVYTVESGDTLSSIAAKFGLQTTEDVASWELLVQSNRPDIVSEDDLLQIGQKLRIPTQQGVIHEVVSDETLSDVASNFGVSTDDIIAVAANAIADPNQVQRGQILLIPNPIQFSAFGGGGTVLPVGPTSVAGFIWPTSGPITSYFGPGHPLGIDIGLYANPSSPIVAALPGTVVFAGGNPCCSYGYYVVVDHANGLETLYAHLSEIDVSVGEQVSQGEVLGIAGTTGYSTGVHLHFEVHKNGSVVDPLQYLP